MNLQSTISIYAGGPGSGCNPQSGHCGRPKGGGGSEHIYHGTSEQLAAKIMKEGLKRSPTGQQPFPVVYATQSKAAALSFAWGAAIGVKSGDMPRGWKGSKNSDKEAALVVLKPGVQKLPHLEDHIDAFPPGINEIDFPKDIPKEYIDRVEIYKVRDIDLEVPHSKNWLEELAPARVIHAGMQQRGETYLVVMVDGSGK